MSIEITATEEKAIIALAIDEPVFFSNLIDQIDSDFFTLDEAKYLFKIIKWFHNEKGKIPSRDMLRGLAEKTLTNDPDDEFIEVLKLCEHEIDPRDYDIIKDRFIKWLRSRTLNEVYKDNIIESVKSGDYTELEKIISKAARLQDLSGEYMWFFNDLNRLFEENIEVKYTTGFPELDRYINEGGPTKGDVLIFMAPTGVGKSIAICNNAAACVKKGLNVLHVTCELSEYKTACRYLGIFSKVNIADRFKTKSKEYIIRACEKIKKSYKGSLVIKEFPPDMINIRTISSLMDSLDKNHGWKPDVIAIDYLELLLSENEYFNRDEYKRQKKVSTEIRQLAKTSNTYIITATQTNRGKEDKNGESDLIDLNRVSESYGKMMPADYVISINQSRSEYGTHEIKGNGDESDIDKIKEKNIEEEKKDKKEINWRGMRLYIAKNRNGPKFKTVKTIVNFDTMLMAEMTEGDNSD